MRTEPLADDLKEQVSAYILFAIENLMPEFQDAVQSAKLSSSDVNYRLIQLETHLLFPNLNDEERWLIAALQLARNTIALGVSTPQDEFDGGEKRKLDAAVTRIEVQFVDLKRELIERQLMNRLTPLQKRIVEKTLNVPFGDPVCAEAGEGDSGRDSALGGWLSKLF